MYNTLELHQFVFTDLSRISRTVNQSNHILANRADEFCREEKNAKSLSRIGKLPLK